MTGKVCCCAWQTGPLEAMSPRSFCLPRFCSNNKRLPKAHIYVATHHYVAMYGVYFAELQHSTMLHLYS